MSGKAIILALLASLALVLFVAIGGDDEMELERHAQWEQEVQAWGC